MKKIAIATMMFLPMTGFAAGFDCAKAGTRVEHMICDNKRLDDLDSQMSSMYKALLKSPDSEQIQKEQREWNKSRNAAQNHVELTQMYRARLEQLGDSMEAYNNHIEAKFNASRKQQEPTASPKPAEEQKQEPVKESAQPVKKDLSNADILAYTEIANLYSNAKLCSDRGLIDLNDKRVSDSFDSSIKEAKAKLTVTYDEQLVRRMTVKMVELSNEYVKNDDSELVKACKEINDEVLNTDSEYVDNVADFLALAKVCGATMPSEHQGFIAKRRKDLVEEAKQHYGKTYNPSDLNAKYTEYVTYYTNSDDAYEHCMEFNKAVDLQVAEDIAKEDTPF